MFDIPALKKSSTARVRLLNIVGLAMLALFAAWNLSLGLLEIQMTDHVIIEVAPALLNVWWPEIADRYGRDVARVISLLQIRGLGFVMAELAVLAFLLRATGLSDALLTPFPSERQNTQELIDKGDLHSVRGQSYGQMLTQRLSLAPRRPPTSGAPAFGRRDTMTMALAAYLGALAYCFIVPVRRSIDMVHEGGSGPEMAALAMLLGMGFLIWAAPHFVVVAQRKLFRDGEKSGRRWGRR